MFRLAVVLVALIPASYASAETITVKYWGDLNLAPFDCTDITSSSFISRSCYDKAKQFMVVQLRGTYYPYCEMPAATYQSFLDASSMGSFYNANIRGTGSDGPFDCRTHRKPSY